MCEFVAFSDHHAHNFRFGAKKVPYKSGGFYNSRLLDSAAVLDEIHTYCVRNKIFTVLFGGDLFHKRTVVHTDVWNITFSALRRFKDSGIHLIMIPGNHDFADRQGHIHSLDSLREVATVMDTVAVQHTAGGQLSVVSVPYTDSLESAKDRLSAAATLASECATPATVLLAHLGMQGARVGSDYVLVSDGDIQVKDVTRDNFDLCLFGHFHQHQKLFPQGYYIGASHQHNWGDANTKRGFLHFKIPEGEAPTFEFIETNAPRFVRLKGDEDSSHVRPIDFVRWSGKDDETMPQALEAIGAENVTVAEQAMPHLSDTDLDAVAAIEAWATLRSTNPDPLIALGKALLAEAESKLL